MHTWHSWKIIWHKFTCKWCSYAQASRYNITISCFTWSGKSISAFGYFSTLINNENTTFGDKKDAHGRISLPWDLGGNWGPQNI
jgi:hypothetical protein